MKRFWIFTFLTITGLLFILFFTNDFGLMDIQKTSFVIAMGIDKGTQDNLVNITAQIAVPDEAEGVKASDIYVENIQTVGDAIAKINLKTGWYPSLVHCRIIILGKDILTTNVFDFLNYFLENNLVEDSCLISTSNQKASETLKASSPIGEVTANAIAKVLSSEAQKTGSVSVSTLREFAKGYFSPSKSSYLPSIDVRAEADNSSGGGGSASEGGGGSSSSDSSGGGGSSGGGSSSGSSSGGGSQGASADIIDASQTAMFYNGKVVATLNAEQTLAFNMAKTKTDFAFGNVQVVENGEIVEYALKMKINKKDISVKMENGIPVVKFTVRARASIVDCSKVTNLLQMAQNNMVPEAVLRSAEQKINKNLTEIIALCGNTNCDLFEIIDSVHKRYYDKYKAQYGEILKNVRPVFDVKFTTMH